MILSGSAVIFSALKGVTGIWEIKVTEAGVVGVAGTLGIDVVTGEAAATGSVVIGAGLSIFWLFLATYGSGALETLVVIFMTSWFGPIVLPSSTRKASITPASDAIMSIFIL